MGRLKSKVFWVTILLKYVTAYKSVNQKPEGEWIMVFASDWLKEHWAFYAYISLDNHEEDIKAVNMLIHRLNWRDGDVYVELINHSGDKMSRFYSTLHDMGHFTHHCALDMENWKKFKHLLPSFLGVDKLLSSTK